MKVGIFCHNGLGDAVNSLILSYNLVQNGHEADVYHNGVELMKEWYPHLKPFHYPQRDEIPKIFPAYDKIVIFHNDVSEFVHELIAEGKKTCPEKVHVIYAYPSVKVYKEPYYEDCNFDPKIPIAENLYRFCRGILKLEKVEKSNGITPPGKEVHKKHPKRVVMHITSSRPGKNWPIEKFVKLALHLEKKGYTSSFVCGSPKDRKGWEWLEEQGFHLPSFQGIGDLAAFLYESGYFVGNDSGLGHLASSMGIPTLTLARRMTFSRFWRPNFCAGKAVVPYKWIPNISGFRLRDRKWKQFITVNRVLREFDRLLSEEKV